MKRLLFLLIPLIFLGCTNQSQQMQVDVHGDQVSDSHNKTHAQESKTVFSENAELFVEFHPLVVGQLSTFSAHLTKLSNQKPFEKGKLTVSLVANKKGIKNSVDSPAEMGIFKSGLIPQKTGKHKLIFEFEQNGEKEKFTIDNVEVYKSEELAEEALSEIEKSKDVKFQKENIWKMDFAVKEIEKQDFNNVVNVSGEILPAQNDKTIISSRSEGFVFFDRTILKGMQINRGENLLSISGGDIAGQNIVSEYLQSKNNFELLKTEHERAERLLPKNLISEKEYLKIKSDFQNAKVVFDNLSKNYFDGSDKITASCDAFVDDVFVSQGEFVNIGQALLSIIKNQRVLLKAEVPQQYFNSINKIQSANFSPSYSDTIYNTDNLDGELISYGKSSNESSVYTPVYFEINKPEGLIPGSFVDIFLISDNIKNAIAIPTESIMENTGKYFVFVQNSGEGFEKREIKILASDGNNVQVSGGLNNGDRVVTKGAYRIKLASMTNELPSHGHVH
ncbi:MAG: efflux RND transporter periplasmic adaptor subunit [Bacteroidales bacterium]|nr:efflux RND transporter periplasmic adaptor subunit [Bacteroidales bacterium]